MIVGTLTIQLHLFGINSLKDKRHIVKSVIERLKSRYNVSVAEVDCNDSKTTALVGVAIVSNDKRFLEEQLDKVISFMRNDGRFHLGQIEREIF
jgi:uncharacterized protein